MLEIVQKITFSETSLTLTLPFEGRQRSRRRVVLSSGEDALLVTPRGTLLRGGEVFALSDGRAVRIVSEPETVSTVRETDTLKLVRVAYHLGNRHVALEIGEGFVRYLHDHVLDDMVRELGLSVCVEKAAFEPEGGAYGGHASSHTHSHDHGEGHHHIHGHAHGQVRNFVEIDASKPERTP